MKKESIVQTLNTWLFSKLNNIHTVLPGQIVSYSGHTERKAEVQIMVKPRTVHNKVLEINPIKNVPVVFPGVGEFNFLFPLQKGDGVLLLFSESPMGNYLNGDGNKPIEADSLNKFDMTDCIAIPGLWNFKSVPINANNKIELDENSTITISTQLGKITIEENGDITFNDGTESFLLGDSMETDMAVFTNLLIAHTHDIVGVQVGTSTISSSVSIGLSGLQNPVTGNLSTQIKGK